MGVLKNLKLLPPLHASSEELLRAIEKRDAKKLRAFERKAEIRGMLLVLNKVWWKIPKTWAEYAVAEASDLSKVTGGYFVFNPKREQVVFVKGRTIKRRGAR